MHEICFIGLAVNKLSDTLGSSTPHNSIYNLDHVERACLYASRRHKMHCSLVVLFDHEQLTLLSQNYIAGRKQTWHNTHQNKC
jgi:hypothetical protein